MERKGGKKRVLIVGAGLAGLSAGYELARAGHDVTILEARPRPGGRIETLRTPFTGGQFAEAGAMSFPDTHPLPSEYARHFGLQVESADPGDGGLMLFLRGQVVKPFDPDGCDWPCRLEPREEAAGYTGMWRRYVTPAVQEIGDPRAPDWPNAAARKYDQMSWQRFLSERGASACAIEVLRVGLVDTWGDGINSVSALLILRDRALNRSQGMSRLESKPTGRGRAVTPGADGSDKERDPERRPERLTLRIAGGNDRLPAAFAQASELEKRIHYLCEVSGLTADSRGFIASYSSPRGVETVHAEHVVCTLPFSVLRGLNLTVELSAEKLHWIHWMGYTDVSRIFMQFKTPIWRATKGDPIVLSDGLTMLTQPQVVSPDREEVILDTYVTGPKARALGRMSEHQRIARVLEALEGVYRGAKKEFVVGASKIWHQDPWAAGGYPFLRPGEVLTSLPACQQTEAGGRLHFAGDHTSLLPGWMQGALESGQRVAREVNEADSQA